MKLRFAFLNGLRARCFTESVYVSYKFLFTYAAFDLLMQ